MKTGNFETFTLSGGQQARLWQGHVWCEVFQSVYGNPSPVFSSREEVEAGIAACLPKLAYSDLYALLCAAETLTE
jgi:hypothetical protein